MHNIHRAARHPTSKHPPAPPAPDAYSVGRGFGEKQMLGEGRRILPRLVNCAPADAVSESSAFCSSASYSLDPARCKDAIWRETCAQPKPCSR
jgi:hypothetical protein